MAAGNIAIVRILTGKWKHIAIIAAIALAALVLVSFVTAKTLYKASAVSLFLYFLPHLVASFCSIRSLSQIERGAE